MLEVCYCWYWWLQLEVLLSWWLHGSSSQSMHFCGELYLPKILSGWMTNCFFEVLFLFMCLCKYYAIFCLKFSNWCIVYEIVFFLKYLFWWLQVVFMSDSDDYSYVERCFNGAASVLPLPLCEMVLINFFILLLAYQWNSYFTPTIFLL